MEVLQLMFCKSFLDSYHPSERRNTKKKALFLLLVFLHTRPFHLWHFQKEIKNVPVWCC